MCKQNLEKYPTQLECTKNPHPVKTNWYVIREVTLFNLAHVILSMTICE